MKEEALEELDIQTNNYVGFIKCAELLNENHKQGVNTINSLQLNQTMKDIFITIMNGLYIMKDAYDVIYVNVVDKCIKVRVDRYGIPDKNDMIKLYHPFREIFIHKAHGVFANDLGELYDDIMSGKLIYEE